MANHKENLVKHYPIVFLQGDEAYNLIDLDEKDRDQFINAIREYIHDDLPDSVNGEPATLNYRINFRTTIGSKVYRIGYTTGDGGCLGVDLIEDN
jgi:transcriptional regulator CtsR